MDPNEMVTLVLSRYVTVAPAVVPGVKIVFVGTTGKMEEVGPGEIAEFDSIKRDGCVTDGIYVTPLVRRLIDAGALVEHSRDEYAEIVDSRRTVIAEQSNLLLTIAPTMQCNFRCTYCFEEHRQQYMSRETEIAVVNLVRARLRAGAPGPISVTWFGGEPLLNMDTIERLDAELASEASSWGREYRRSIITNGFLITERMAGRLAALGQWDLVQVTLDGTPAVHDGRRKLVSGQGTWTRVVRGIEQALAAGLPVAIRMNIDKWAGSTDLFREVVGELLTRRVLPNASIYLGAIHDSTPACGHVRDAVLSRRRFASAELSLRRVLLEAGLPSGATVPQPSFCRSVCTADASNGYVIGPAGLLFKCWNEVYLDRSHAIGTVFGDVSPVDEANLAAWRRYDPIKPACVSCHALPGCMGGCPWENRRSESDFGECGAFKFFPEQIVTTAHGEALASHVESSAQLPVRLSDRA
jgi:uncharacterized protein